MLSGNASSSFRLLVLRATTRDTLRVVPTVILDAIESEFCMRDQYSFRGSCFLLLYGNKLQTASIEVITLLSRLQSQ